MEKSQREIQEAPAVPKRWGSAGASLQHGNIASGVQSVETEDATPDSWSGIGKRNRLKFEIKKDLSSYARFPFGSKAFPVRGGKYPGIEIQDEQGNPLLLIPHFYFLHFIGNLIGLVFFSLLVLAMVLLLFWDVWASLLLALALVPLVIFLVIEFLIKKRGVKIQVATARENDLLDLKVVCKKKADGIWHSLIAKEQTIGHLVRQIHANGSETWYLLNTLNQSSFRCHGSVILADDLRYFPSLWKRKPVRWILQNFPLGKQVGVFACERPWVQPFELDLSHDPQGTLDRRLALMFVVLCISPKRYPGNLNPWDPLLDYSVFLAKPLFRTMGKGLVEIGGESGFSRTFGGSFLRNHLSIYFSFLLI